MKEVEVTEGNPSFKVHVNFHFEWMAFFIKYFRCAYFAYQLSCLRINYLPPNSLMFEQKYARLLILAIIHPFTFENKKHGNSMYELNAFRNIYDRNTIQTTIKIRFDISLQVHSLCLILLNIIHIESTLLVYSNCKQICKYLRNNLGENEFIQISIEEFLLIFT